MSVKQEILSILEQNKNTTISGQALAAQLRVSRSAVWKAIKTLQEDGHKIHAATKTGYRLEAESDILSAEGVRAFLNAAEKDCPVMIYPSIDSTSSQAKRLALDGAPHGTAVLADEQTAGRGRMGKSFFSPAKTGLYMSVILRPATDLQNAQLVTIYAAVSVCKAIERLTGLSPRIKWVNDLYLHQKKICGILAEASSDFESGTIDSLVVGIGLNCFTREEDFPQELRGIAGSLLAASVSRNELAAAILSELLAGGDCRFPPDLIESYRARSFLTGKKITYHKNGHTCLATVRGINEHGNLVVADEEGEIDILQAGEISIWEENSGK